MAGKKAIPKVVEAERFVLRDADGAVRAELSTGRGGVPQFQLNSADGRARILLMVDNSGRAIIELLGVNGRAQAGMSAGEDGCVGISFFHKGGQPAFSVGYHFDEDVHLEVRDKEGRRVWQAEIPHTPSQ